MAKNICPNCLQVIISLGDESSIRCPLCERVFTVQGEDDGGKNEYGDN